LKSRSDIKPSDYFCERDPLAFPLWQKAVIGIAGAGGLGSNAAMLLARSGIGKLIIADFDHVSISNLNRQFFNLDQIGLPKTKALEINLTRINPFIALEMHQKRVTRNNIPTLFKEADLMIEAFDKDSEKLILIETWQQHFPKKALIIASGLAGYGRSEDIKIQQEGSLYIVGDQCSALTPGIAPIAPRVMIVAAMQANLALQIIASKH
jgi:sulfur carrier protein ThiS adenylyltransferase